MMFHHPDLATVRIGELARRTGVPAELLRAWERRYALLEPIRSSGGYRLYTSDDERRVMRMTELLAHGHAAAEAALLAKVSGAARTRPEHPRGEAATALAAALERYDDAQANEILDDAIATLGTDTVLASVVLPAIRTIGTRYCEGKATIAQEHFASALLRGRLLGLARGWGRGTGPRVILACPPGEQHDVGLIALGLCLRARGLTITYLGQDTPIETLAGAAAVLEPAFVVVSATLPCSVADDLRALFDGLDIPLYLCGTGSDSACAEAAGAVLLHGDPVRAADELAARVSGRMTWRAT